jgi:hypothetical protein
VVVVDVDVVVVVSARMDDNVVTLGSVAEPVQAVTSSTIERTGVRCMSDTRLRTVRMEARTISAQLPDIGRRGPG